MLRDQHPFPPFANVPRGKILERRADYMRHTDIRRILCSSHQDFLPKTDLGNHCLADHPQRKQQRVDSVFEAADLSINRQSPPSVPMQTLRGEKKDGKENLICDFLRTGQGVPV